MSLIAALGRGNRVIGRDGGLPWHLPADLKRFKRLTMGHPLIMGRRTYESIGRPLPGRRNLVLTRQPDYAAPGCEVVGSLDEALRHTADAEEVFVIGGAGVFAEALPLANRLHLTWVEGTHAGDTFFPEIDPDAWTVVAREALPADAANPYACEFVTLHRVG